MLAVMAYVASSFKIASEISSNMFSSIHNNRAFVMVLVDRIHRESVVFMHENFLPGCFVQTTIEAHPTAVI